MSRRQGDNHRLAADIVQAQRLRREYGVYMLDSSRINVAGINARNLDYVAQSVTRVLTP